MERIVNFWTWIGLTVLILITAIAFIDPLKAILSNAELPSALNCTNPDNHIGIKATCIVIKFFLFAFVVTCISIAWRWWQEKR